MTDSYRVPVCFDNVEQWREYQKAWKLSKGKARINYCFDCTPSFQSEMIKTQRCAHPHTRFKIREGELVGVRVNENGEEEKQKRGFVLNGVVIR